MLLGGERHLQGQDEQELRELMYVLLLQNQGKRGTEQHAERLRLVRPAWLVWCPEFQTTTITLSVCFLGHADAGEALYRGIAN